MYNYYTCFTFFSMTKHFNILTFTILTNISESRFLLKLLRYCQRPGQKYSDDFFYKSNWQPWDNAISTYHTM